MAAVRERPGGKSGSEESLSMSVAELIDSWEHPVALIDPEYLILGANRAYREAFGEGAVVRGKTCHQVSHRSRLPCDEMGESCPLRETLASGRPCRSLHVHFTAQGREHHEVSMRPVHAEDGRIVALLEEITPLEAAHAQAGRGDLVGASRSFRDALSLIRRAAPSETTVLLLGETGTGKELLARAVHELSARKSGAFVPVDCSGLTETLFESELFGHEKGSFTGATHRKRGLIEAADGGTLFLDEVGDIPLNLQVKLLRLLESNTYRRVGSPQEYRANHRLVCATHKNLEEMVRTGAFRADLYYRLSVFPVPVPPLRERREDVPLLVESLLHRLRPGRELVLSAQAQAALGGYDYPGNVRELLNLLERAVLLVDGPRIELEHLPPKLGGGLTAGALVAEDGGHRSPPGVGGGELLSLEEQERRYLRWALACHEGDKRSLADKLEVSERTLYRKLSGLRDT